jgi:hypothetical protein
MDALFHWLVVIGVGLMAVFGKRLGEILESFRNGPGGGPPTHPLPVTSPIETSRPSSPHEKRWQA